MMKKNPKKLITQDIDERFESEKKLIPKLNKKEFSAAKVISIVVMFVFAFLMLFGIILPLLKL